MQQIDDERQWAEAFMDIPLTFAGASPRHKQPVFRFALVEKPPRNSA
jgi:hypothetical protein